MKNNLIYYTILVFLLIYLKCNSQNNSKFNHVKLVENAIYVIGKGTTSKSKLIAENFNISNKNITHVGIGFVYNKKIKIYHVVDDNKKAFRISTLEEFTNTDYIYYLGVWQYKSSFNELEKLRSICNNYSKQDIRFDYSFSLNNENNLYCSEFCFKVLNKLNKTNFNYKPTEKKLNNFYKNVLNKDTLIYYPVDFFQQNKKFKLVYEKHLKKNIKLIFL